MRTRAKTYKHKPLQKTTHIRVLVLQAELDSQPALQCSLEHMEISDASFTALSYAWGNQALAFEMEVISPDGISEGYIPLTTSLNNAIRDLQACTDIQSKRFWIDQICINQQDEKEKGAQVAMMGSIYTRARQVITHLGPAEADDGEAIALIEEVYRRADLHAGGLDRLPYVTETMLTMLRDKAVQLDPHTLALPGLHDILYGPWTERLWMVPEAILNQNTSVLRGKTALPWMVVVTVACLLSYSLRDSVMPGEWDVGLRVGVLRGARLQATRERLEGSEGDMRSLFGLMGLLQTSRCFDPRDRVFALLGIASDAQQLGIKPDYSKPVERVFTELAVAHLKVHRHLDFLSFCMREPRASRHRRPPSWTPLLDFAPRKEWSMLRPQEASAGRPARYSFEADETVLVLRGLFLDEAARRVDMNDWSLAAMLREAGRPSDAEASNLASFCEAVQTVRRELGDSPETDAALACVFFQNSRWSRPSLGAGTFFRHCAARIARDNQRAGGTASEADAGRAPGDQADLPGILAAELQSLDAGMTRERVEELLREARYLGSRRSLCITRARRLCLALESTEPGDQLVLLLGGGHAYSLRPRGDAYQLVGDVFYPGFMNGEAFAELSWPEKVMSGTAFSDPGWEEKLMNHEAFAEPDWEQNLVDVRLV
ncbi:unnamed protein product [Diplocarpon coronariae]